MIKLLVGLLLSTLALAGETDGFNPDIFTSRKWKDYDQCETAMFMITFGIRNEFNTKRVIHDEKKSVWYIHVGRRLELTCTADGHYTGRFADSFNDGTYINPARPYRSQPENVKPYTPDIKIPDTYNVI